MSPSIKYWEVLGRCSSLKFKYWNLSIGKVLSIGKMFIGKSIGKMFILREQIQVFQNFKFCLKTQLWAMEKMLSIDCLEMTGSHSSFSRKCLLNTQVWIASCFSMSFKNDIPFFLKWLVQFTTKAIAHMWFRLRQL